MRPASSNISASIIPGLFLKSATLASPRITASAASLLQSGHNERVLRGTPTIICILSRLLSSRPGAQVGHGNSPSGRIALTILETSHAPFDAMRKIRASPTDMYVNLRLLERRDPEDTRPLIVN